MLISADDHSALDFTEHSSRKVIKVEIILGIYIEDALKHMYIPAQMAILTSTSMRPTVCVPGWSGRLRIACTASGAQCQPMHMQNTEYI